MCNYKLNVKSKNDALKVASEVDHKYALENHTVGDTKSSVAWISFAPWQSVEWEETFELYASRGEVSSTSTEKFSDKQFIIDTRTFDGSLFEEPIIDEKLKMRDDFISLNLCRAKKMLFKSKLTMIRITIVADSGEVLATTDIPKKVLENAVNYIITYDDEKKEYYLQVK